MIGISTGTLSEWSCAFKGVPDCLQAGDPNWVQRPDNCIRFWQGESKELLEGMSLIRGGGHFPGGGIRHGAAGAEGKAVVRCVDIATANLDRKSFALMGSDPNIPRSAQAIPCHRRGAAALPFDRVYSHHFERVIPAGRQTSATGVRGAMAAIGGAYARA